MRPDLIALTGLVLTVLGLFVQGALFAFFLGKLAARVAALEACRRDLEGEAAAIAAMTATLQALKESVDDIRVTFSRRFEAVEHTVKKLMMAPGRRRALAGED